MTALAHGALADEHPTSDARSGWPCRPDDTTRHVSSSGTPVALPVPVTEMPVLPDRRRGGRSRRESVVC